MESAIWKIKQGRVALTGWAEGTTLECGVRESLCEEGTFT